MSRLLRFSLIVSTTLLLVAVAPGCGNRDGKRASGPSTQTQVHVAKRDHFGLALRYLFDIEASQRASDEAVYHLNRWTLAGDHQVDWTADPLITRLMPEIRAIPELKNLDQLKFIPTDRSFIEETWWLHSISQQALTQPLSASTRQWLDSQTQLASQDRKELEEACQLFDWTIRHIFAEPLLVYPKILAVGPSFGQTDQAKQPPLPSMRGEAGPGYRFFPLQNLMIGRGDALNRARIILLLCRQRGLSAFMLGVDPGGTPRPKPWLTAVLIGGQLYLFDPELGLPLPGKSSGSIATLNELRSDPQWVSRLADGETPYSHDSRDLEKLVALIDASPEYLSRRMAFLQASLPSKHEMVLSTQPTELASRLQAADPFFAESGRVRLWNLPFETAIFQNNYRQYVERSPNQAARDIRPISMLQQLPLLSEARRRHALGLYLDQPNQPGAKTLYLQARTPNDQLTKLSQSPDLQRAWGLTQGDRESPQQFAARIAQHIEMRKEAKYLASYWLATAHYDSGMIDVAVNWFKDRTLDAFPQGELNAGAQYHLARCYESLDQLDKAATWLKRTSWPQQHGDRLRAAMLQADEKP